MKRLLTLATLILGVSVVSCSVEVKPKEKEEQEEKIESSVIKGDTLFVVSDTWTHRIWMDGDVVYGENFLQLGQFYENNGYESTEFNSYKVKGIKEGSVVIEKRHSKYSTGRRHPKEIEEFYYSLEDGFVDFYATPPSPNEDKMVLIRLCVKDNIVKSKYIKLK